MVSIWKRSALLILSCSLTSGCVTMMRGTSEEIKIFTDPGGARATLSDGQSCDTPCTLTTKRRDDLTVVVQKAGCQSATAKMPAVMDSTGVLVGGIVDMANGAVYVHQPNPLSVQLACGPPADSPQAAPQLSTATANANAAPAAVGASANAPAAPATWRSYHDVPPTTPAQLVGRALFLCCNLVFDGDGDATDSGYLLTYDKERIVLAVGTPIRVTEAKADEVTFTANGQAQQFTLALEYGSPKISSMQYFPLVLRDADPSPQLAALTPETQAAIRDGRLVYGMTREQAAMARGYPPFHQTPDLDAPTWLFYDDAETGQYVSFTNGQITSIKAGPPP